MQTRQIQIDRDLPNECKLVDNHILKSTKSGRVSAILRTVLIAHAAGIPFHLGDDSNQIFDIEAVFHTIKILEGIASRDTTKGPFQYSKGPLKGLWKKHFFQASFMPENLLAELSIKRNGGIEKFYKAMNEKYGRDKWLGKPFSEDDGELIAKTFVGDAIDARSNRRLRGPGFGLTGEHLIFRKQPRGNIYLFVATHTADHQIIRNYMVE